MKQKHFFRIILLTLLLAACTQTPEFGSQTATDEIPFSGDALDYHNRLRGMWLGSTIANWTGLRTEGMRNEPPFYTDEDWGEIRPVRWSDEELPIEFVFQDPWLADDDTDIEYVYLHLMDLHGSPMLTADQLSAGWQEHINHHIWVSNASARALMRIGAKSPVTSMLTINENSLAIDAQLTTEIFGAMAPGMPGQALQLANLPIQTTASGYSTHAAQFFVVLYSLASQVDQNQEPKQQVLWLVNEARQYIPNESKTADIVDFVMADYLSNPEPDNWELTRDKLYERYHQDATENGFVYRDWIESSVNFGTGLIALLYGEGDFKRTVQIGTLSGWDSDNGTSSMAGVVGLMIGYEALVAQFPQQEISDRYHILRTRDDMPDYLPEDSEAEDRFSEMAERMIPLIEQHIVAAGGGVSDGRWRLPEIPHPKIDQNPAVLLTSRSQNNSIQRSGGMVLATVNGQPADALADGLEFDFSGREIFQIPKPFTIQPTGDPITLSVDYGQSVEIDSIRLVEGSGSGFDSVTVELMIDDRWVPAQLNRERSGSPSRKAYEMLEFWLTQPATITGIRLIGEAEASSRELHFVELDSFAPEGGR